ncbi:MAG: ATP-dependent Clp protease proteolytic subunit [Ruminococcus sp.]|nr:ATP-dependent Clp protease proteolytic subunit [Ruminococcus sp.]MCM1381403.1 ATP-dependent Clp protease proteolytic subunit [Muribaculaceae bacterium]MCM1479874.1 ATP-dependent Clp protease proteolytic subunit [Muribaculaceae bacterium]
MSSIIKDSVRGTDLVPVEDVLLAENQVFLTGEVNAFSADNLIKQLMYFDSKNSDEIILYINSPGGEVMSGLAVYDFIKIMKSPVKTVCIGDAASMAAIIFLAGSKREMLTHSRILIHDPAYGHLDVSGKKPHEIQRGVDSLNKVRETLAEIIAEKTGKSLDEIYEITAEDNYFTADEAIEFGLATAIYKGGNV